MPRRSHGSRTSAASSSTRIPVRAEDLEHPDELRVDLDPVPGVEVARSPRGRASGRTRRLAEVGLVGWPKTSGSRGIHIYVRIEPRWTFDEVRRAALALARDVERRAPRLATSKWWKEERHGVFIDYNQNAKDRTIASAYSVRPTPDARVSAPIDWGEVPTRASPATSRSRRCRRASRALGDLHARHRRHAVARALDCRARKGSEMRRGRRTIRRSRRGERDSRRSIAARMARRKN